MTQALSLDDLASITKIKFFLYIHTYTTHSLLVYSISYIFWATKRSPIHNVGKNNNSQWLKMQTWEAGEDDPSDEGLIESEGDLAGARVDSDKAGQETASMTCPTSAAAPFEGLFQAGLFPPLPFSEFSAIDSSTAKVGGGAARAEGTAGSIAAAGDDGDVVMAGEEVAAAAAIIGSDSPRTICVHGGCDDGEDDDGEDNDETALAARRDWGLPMVSPDWRGELLLLMLAAIDDDDDQNGTEKLGFFECRRVWSTWIARVKKVTNFQLNKKISDSF